LENVAPEKRQEILDELKAAVASFRHCLELQPDNSRARRDVELVRQWIKYYSDRWLARDRERRRQETNLVAFLEFLIETQRALRESVKALTATVPADAFAEPKQVQDKLHEEIPPLKEKIKTELAPPQPGSGTAPQGNSREQEQGITLLQGWASAAGEKMSSAARLLGGRQAAPAAADQQSAIDELEKIWDAVIPFHALLARDRKRRPGAAHGNPAANTPPHAVAQAQGRGRAGTTGKAAPARHGAERARSILRPSRSRKNYPTQPFEVTLRVLVRPLPDDPDRDPLVPLRRRPPHLEANWVDLPPGLTGDDKARWLEKLLAENGSGFTLNDVATRSGSFFDGPRLAVFSLYQRRESRKGLDGRPVNYFIYELKRKMTAEKAGTYPFGPAIVKGSFVAGMEGSSYTGRRLVAVVRLVPVEVREVPLPRPATFCGGIGDYRLAASANPTALRVGDPLTFTLGIITRPSQRIAGSDLKTLPIPRS